MRTVFWLCMGLVASSISAAPPLYKMEKLVQTQAGLSGKYMRVFEFTNSERVCFRDQISSGHTPVFELEKGSLTNLSTKFIGSNFGPYAVFSSESGKYAVAPDPDYNGFLHDGLTGENYGPAPYSTYQSVNVMGITERFTFGSSFFSLIDHGYNELAYIYDHVSRVRYDFVVDGNADGDKRRTTAMNEAGQAVVEYFPGPEPYNPSNVQKCELWQNGVRKVIGEMTDAKINSSGQVIGRILALNNPNRGMMQFWDGTTTQMFSNLDGNPTSLSDNNLALVTFNSDNAYYPSKLLDVNTRTGYDLHDLTPNMPAGMITYHGLIRADGAIAAIGVENGKSYLLKFTPVPEPASSLALAAGLTLLLRRRRPVR